jgi:hypothetical protein
LNYHQREDTLFFKNLVVPKLEERKVLVKDIHEEIEHFSKGRTLAEVKKRHYKIETMRVVVKQCQRCQLAKNSGSIRLGVEEMKNIPIYDLFNRVTLDIARPLLEIKNGNMYVLVTIGHYWKWCETRLVKDHDATTTIRFMGEEIICRFGVPKFILTNNGGE